MIRTLACAAVALAAIGVGSAAEAANCVTMTLSPASPVLTGWDPLTTEAKEATFTATLTRNNSGTRSVRLIFLDNNSNATPTKLGTNGPSYEIVNLASNAVISYPQGTQVTALTIPLTQFGGGNQPTETVNLKVRILGNTGQDYTGGVTFSETLRYSAQCFRPNGTDNGVDNAAASNLNLSLQIPKKVSIVTAGPATIDFNSFTAAQQDALIKVKSTSTLNVSATTTNGRRLMLGTSTADNAVIPYEMRFGPNGSTLAVLPANQTLNVTRAGVAGADYALRLSLTGGVPTGKLAGSYSDTITLTISPGT